MRVIDVLHSFFQLSPTEKVTLSIDLWDGLSAKILVNGKPSLFNFTRLPVTRARPTHLTGHARD